MSFTCYSYLLYKIFKTLGVFRLDDNVYVTNFLLKSSFFLFFVEQNFQAILVPFALQNDLNH